MDKASSIAGAFWLDGLDVDDVPLLTVPQSGGGIDWFDAFLPPAGGLPGQEAQAAASGQQPQQQGQSEGASGSGTAAGAGAEAEAAAPPAPKPKPKKKKSLSKAEKARIEREKNRWVACTILY